jgi:hypothetical protein
MQFPTKARQGVGCRRSVVEIFDAIPTCGISLMPDVGSWSHCDQAGKHSPLLDTSSVHPGLVGVLHAALHGSFSSLKLE